MEKEYLILFSVLINFLIGLFIFLKEKNKKIGAHFLVSVLILTFWSLFLHFYHSQFALNPSQWLKIISLLTIIFVFEFLFFIIAISNKSLKDFRVFLITSVFLLTIIISAFFFNERISAAASSPPLITFFLCLFIYGAWLGMILLERMLKTADIEHLQRISILTGFGAFITFIAIFNAFVPLISGKNFSWVNSALSTLLTIFIAFTISRYYLFKNKIIWLDLSIGAMGAILLTLPFLVPNYKLKILTAFVFFLFSFLGYYLIKITREEFKKREEVETIVKEWEKLNVAKDQFVLSFQHHLRTPLVPIKGYLEMILKGAYGREENPVIREKLIEMKKLATTLYTLIEGLVDIQEMQMGKKILNLEDYQIDNLIESIIEELKPSVDEKGLYLNFEKSSLPAIKMDKKRMREAIWNLVDNAIKYTNEGGVVVAATIEDEKLKITVSDTGIGMEKEEIDYFLKGQLFERGEEAKRLYGPGRGIGLNLAIEFVKAHGGGIRAESKGKGKGSTFLIEMPIK